MNWRTSRVDGRGPVRAHRLHPGGCSLSEEMVADIESCGLTWMYCGGRTNWMQWTKGLEKMRQRVQKKKHRKQLSFWYLRPGSAAETVLLQTAVGIGIPLGGGQCPTCKKHVEPACTGQLLNFWGQRKRWGEKTHQSIFKHFPQRMQSS